MSNMYHIVLKSIIIEYKFDIKSEYSIFIFYLIFIEYFTFNIHEVWMFGS
jgi:hypothetical protein